MAHPYPDEGEVEYDDGTMPENLAVLHDAVIGHKIVSAELADKERTWGLDHGLRITLDNGQHVFLANTSDCCAYTEVQNFLLHVQHIDHIITGVGSTGQYTTWHIYADAGDILTLDVGWTAGNPFYYGYGFQITVSEAPMPAFRTVEEANEWLKRS